MNIKSRVRDKDGNVFNSVAEFFLESSTVDKSQLNRMLNDFLIRKEYKYAFCNLLMDNNFVKAYNFLVEKWAEEEWGNEFVEVFCQCWGTTIERSFEVGDEVKISNFNYFLQLGSDDSFLAGLPYESIIHYSYMRAPTEDENEEYHIVHIGKRVTPMGRPTDTAYIEDRTGRGYVVDVRGLTKV